MILFPFVLNSLYNLKQPQQEGLLQGFYFGILRYLQEFPSQGRSAGEMFLVRIYSFAECNGPFVIRWKNGTTGMIPVGRKE